MKRVLPMVVAAILLAVPAFAQTGKPSGSGTSEKGSSAGSASKTMSATGTVASVSASSLTVKGKSGDMTFTVDEKTHVTASGASHKSAANKADNKPTQITDMVHEGDQVTVKYHDMGATKHAADVRVSKAAAGAAPKK